MKFTSSLSSLLVLLPLLAQQVSASPLNFNSGVVAGGQQPGKDITTAPAAAASVAPAKAATTAAVAATSAAPAKAVSSAVAAAPSAAASVAAAPSAAAAASVSAAAAASASAAAAPPSNSADLQSSLTLDPSVIAKGFEDDGQDVPAAGQVPSLTSSNNFINFCATVPQLPITNGQQIVTGSCNPAPMGVIAAQTNMPSSKFTNPVNGQVLPSNTAFTISMAISHLQTGFFVNAEENYFAAPQVVNSAGDVQGHSHVVVETIGSLTQTTTTNPTVFAFFKGLNSAAVGGILTASVDKGLPAGTYRLSSINTAANHQPVLVAVAQHGSLDDQVYFTVADDVNSVSSGLGNSTSTAPPSATESSDTASSVVSSAAAATSSVSIKGQNTGGKPGVQGGFLPANSGKGQNSNQNQNQNANNGKNQNNSSNNNNQNNNQNQGNDRLAQPPQPNRGGFGFGGFKVKRQPMNRARIAY